MEEFFKYLNGHSINELINFVQEKHKNQKDKLENPYIEHVLFVSNNCQTIEGKIVGLCHDLFEDTDTTIEELKKLGLSDKLINSILILTRNKSISYFDYIKIVAKDKIATEVKLSDIKHHLLKSRRKGLTDSLLNRYTKAKQMLEGTL